MGTLGSVYMVHMGEIDTRDKDWEAGKDWHLIVGSELPFSETGIPAGLGDRQIGAWQ